MHWIKNLNLFLMGILCLILGATTFFSGSIYDYQDSATQDHLPPVDVIVCLGGGKGRITAAAEVWYRYWKHQQTPILYFSGMGQKSHWNLISKQIRKEILTVLNQQHIWIEKTSGNTVENAQWFINYAKKNHWENALLLTSSYHMKRAHWIFQHVLKQQKHLTLALQIKTLSLKQSPFVPQQWYLDWNAIRVTVSEYWKWIYYSLFYKETLF